MLNELIETTQLANRLLKEHGLTEQGWTFSFSNRKTHVGTCFHTRKQIVFSKWYVQNHPDEIHDTILHEIAHALVGPNHGHDNVWRRKALELGCKPERCADDTVEFSGNYNYVLECPNDCNAGPWHRHRMTQRAWYGICPNCRDPLTITDLRTGRVYDHAS
jgi:predicted SprT family Zn-dependent metalloprotease